VYRSTLKRTSRVAADGPHRFGASRTRWEVRHGDLPRERPAREGAPLVVAPARKGRVMRLPVAGIALPSAALSLSLAHVPWYAWLPVALTSLAVLAWRFKLDHHENLERLQVRRAEIEADRAVKLEEIKVKHRALEGIEKVDTEHPSQLMASITPGAAGVESTG